MAVRRFAATFYRYGSLLGSWLLACTDAHPNLEPAIEATNPSSGVSADASLSHDEAGAVGATWQTRHLVYGVGGGSSRDAGSGASSGAAGAANPPLGIAGSGGRPALPDLDADGGVPPDDAGRAVCDGPQGEVVRLATAAEFEQFLVDDWYPCGQSLFCQADQGAGLRFSADGTWTQLGAAEPLTPAYGTWHVIDIGSQNWQGSYQLNLVVGSGTFITIPTVGADGIHLRLGAFGGCAGDYVRSGAVPAPAHARRIQDVWVDATPLARQPDATSGELCQHAAERVEDATSRGRVLAGLPGLWKLCGGTTPFWQSSESGLELGADGRWFKLYADASGSLWRALSWGERGTWEVLEDTGQLNLYAYGSGTYIVNPVRLSSDGQQLELNSTGQIGFYARFSAP